MYEKMTINKILCGHEDEFKNHVSHALAIFVNLYEILTFYNFFGIVLLMIFPVNIWASYPAVVF